MKWYVNSQKTSGSDFVKFTPILHTGLSCVDCVWPDNLFCTVKQKFKFMFFHQHQYNKIWFLGFNHRFCMNPHLVVYNAIWSICLVIKNVNIWFLKSLCRAEMINTLPHVICSSLAWLIKEILDSISDKQCITDWTALHKVCLYNNFTTDLLH